MTQLAVHDQIRRRGVGHAELTEGAEHELAAEDLLAPWSSGHFAK